MIHEADILSHLRAVNAREMSIEDFEDWLDGASWNMHADSSDAAIRLAAPALLALSQYGLGLRSESSLRDELRRLSGERYFEVRISIAFDGLSALDRPVFSSASHPAQEFQHRLG